MPRDENITISFNADIKNLKAGISDANKSIQLANAEFKAASSHLENWEESTEGLNAKLGQLNKVLTEENKKLENYKSQLKRTKEEEDKNTKSAEKLRKQYEQAVEQYGKTSSEAKKYKDELTKVEQNLISNAKETEKLNITILNQHGRVKATEKELGKYREQLKKVQVAEKEVAKSGKDVSTVLKEIDNVAEETGSGFTILKGSIANLVATGITNIISGFKNIVDNSREFRLEMGKVNTAFTTAGFSAEIASKTYDDFYGILGDPGQTTEAVAHLAKLAKTEEDLAKWTDIAAGVYGTFGSSIPLESLTEAANETAKTGELTGALSDALSWSGVNVELYGKALKSAKTEEERLQIITKTLSNEFGEASEKYQTVNKDIIASNKAQANLNKTMAEVAQKVSPITTSLQNGFAQVLEKILELVNESGLDGFAEKVASTFDKFIEDILPKIVDGLKWILENKDQIIAGILALGAAFATMNVANMIMGLVESFQKFKTAQDGATVAQWLFNAAMNANPVGIIIAAITGLVAAFIYLWNTSDKFREFWINLWDGITGFFKENWQEVLLLIVNPIAGAFALLYKHCDGFREFVDNFMEKVSKLFKDGWDSVVKFFTKSVPNWVSNIIDNLSKLPGEIGKVLTSVIDKIVKWGSDLVGKGRKAVGDLYDTIVNKIKEIPGKMFSIGSDIVKGLWNGINDMVGWVTGKIQGFSSSVLDGIKNFFGVKSPSKVMEKVVGNNLVKGLIVGIDNKTKDAVKAMQNLSSKLIEPAKGIVSDINGSLNKTNVNLSGAVVKSGATYNYTQINNSPKALSRFEIYKQTKNALNFATL